MAVPGVIVAVDVDNLLISSREAGQGFTKYNLETGFRKMFEWIQTFAKILCVHFYLPASQSGNDALWNTLWEEYRERFYFFEAIYCPKRKTENALRRTDDVDRHLIGHTIKLAEVFGDQVQYFCLGSGDLDYSPLLWQLKREREIKIAFAIGSEQSFSSVYRQMEIAAKNPVTNEELIHYFSPQKDT